MDLFKKNKRFQDLPAPPKPDFSVSKLSFEDDFPKYTPSVGGFDVMKEQNKGPSQMPSKVLFDQEKVIKKSSGPIFIKIEKYEQALNHINSIREKVKEVEKVIENLKKIKRDEDQALDEWKDSLNEIKEKLLTVDKTLFEN